MQAKRRHQAAHRMHKRRQKPLQWRQRNDGLETCPAAARSTHRSRMLRAVVWVWAFMTVQGAVLSAADPDGAAVFRKDVEPILAEYCFGCHAAGAAKARIAFDEFK